MQKEQHKVKPMQKKPQAKAAAKVMVLKEAVRVQAKAVEAEEAKAVKVALVLEAPVKVAKEEKVEAKAKAVRAQVKVQEKVKANHREQEKEENLLKMATHLAVENHLRTLNKQRKRLKKQLMEPENAVETVILINLMK